jgi:hypothetical protein
MSKLKYWVVKARVRVKLRVMPINSGTAPVFGSFWDFQRARKSELGMEHGPAFLLAPQRQFL